MPLVMVHGVSTRDTPTYRSGVEKQRDMLAGLALRGLASTPTILHPYWGGHGARPAWGGASLPDGSYESFGADDQAAALVQEVAPGLEGPNPLLTLARRDLVAAVDLLWVLVPPDRSNAEVAELGAKAGAYAEAQGQPAWLGEVTNDQQFLTRLAIEVDGWQPQADSSAATTGWESFGVADVWDRVREGAGRMVSAPARVVGSAAVAAGRAKAQNAVALFLGDVFVYLDKRDDAAGRPGQIPQVVIEAVDQALDAVSPADPHLVLMGHSMGGNILYDVLTYYRPDLNVDAFVTVGSQVPFFEELKLFHASETDIPSQGTPKLALRSGIRHWLNVFDRQDILSFSGRAVFDRIEDFDYSTGASVLGAHTTYLERPSFHLRLNERLHDALVP